MSTAGTKNLLDMLTEGRTLPEGYDSWGIKSTRPDLTTRGGYRWPFPGGETPRYELLNHGSSCPREAGDGLCVATDWSGMASGGFPAVTLLLVAYNSDEARGDEPGKLRVPQALVVDLIDGQRLVREHGKNANLIGANLHRANLTTADLSHADLSYANLRHANLFHADLGHANLRHASLRYANLSQADLSHADLFHADLHGAILNCSILTHADLRYASLHGAILTDANLNYANLHRANLTDANLSHADLYDADLLRANLTDANLTDAITADQARERGATL